MGPDQHPGGFEPKPIRKDDSERLKPGTRIIEFQGIDVDDVQGMWAFFSMRTWRAGGNPPPFQNVNIWSDERWPQAQEPIEPKLMSQISEDSRMSRAGITNPSRGFNAQSPIYFLTTYKSETDGLDWGEYVYWHRDGNTKQVLHDAKVRFQNDYEVNVVLDKPIGPTVMGICITRPEEKGETSIRLFNGVEGEDGRIPEVERKSIDPEGKEEKMVIPEGEKSAYFVVPLRENDPLQSGGRIEIYST